LLAGSDSVFEHLISLQSDSSAAAEAESIIASDANGFTK
jgi:hypothetical protein